MMQSDNNNIISLTNDPEKFKVCAMMMALSDPWITLGIDYDLSLKAFKGPCKEIYVAENENQIAGFVILQICGTFKGYIQTICINKKYRGMGFGKKLLHFSEERIAKISPNVSICVSKFNTGAIKLYYEFGFKLVGELKDFVKEGFDELLLRKTSGPIIGYDSPAGKTNT